MVRLRVLTADDWPLWREARLAALTEAPHAFVARLADWHRGGEEQWRVRFAMPGAHHVLAVLDDGRTAGTARGVPSGGDVCELRSVWVAAGARGHGVGGRLVAEVEAWARRSGAAALRLTVVPGNEPAVELYRRHGFVLADDPGAPLPDGTGRELVMVKQLRRPAPRAGRTRSGPPRGRPS
ncbi:hypothetical protein GCM10010406_03940 [Streptomyces thermolineatus]|uniref:N-acetyltransferase domain-containing protein n=1 Tax=Streptomyces thermolineatus TaxID=44033 RepID=A0ABN3KTI5_9ACTN